MHARYPIVVNSIPAKQSLTSEKMAAADTMMPSALPVHAPSLSTELPSPKLKDAGNDAEGMGDIRFEASKHLNFTPPSKVYTMKELGYDDNVGVSPVGVSEPFPLFSEEAVQQMRKEVLSEKVWSHYRFSSNLAQCQLRGFASE